MKTGFPPALIVLTLVFLSITAFFGAISASADLGRWRVLGAEIFPAWAIWKAIVLSVIPTLAVIDLVFRRPAGRYLAIVPMLWLFGLCLRPFLELPFSGDLFDGELIRGLWFLFGIFTISLGATISGLAFSKTVRSYLNS